MSGQSCCITIAVFLIILQQIPPGIGAMKPWPAFRGKAGKKSSGRNRCGPHFPQFSAELKVINPNNKALSTFTFQCTAVVIANVRSATGKLRCCGRLNKAKKKRRLRCPLRSDFMAVISVVRGRTSVQNCTLTFSFIELTGAHFNKTLELTIFPGKRSTSTFFVNGKPTRFLSSYVTHTVFPVATASRSVDQPFITSSIIVDNSTMHSTKKISSTVVKRQPSLSFVPSYTGIVTTPSITESLTSKPLLMTSSLTESLVSITSIQASATTSFTVVKRQPSLSFVPSYTGIVTIPSITDSLSSKPLLMTSSLTESLVSITSIQASATSRFLLTSTLSLPGREKIKKLKQDIEFINNVNISTVKISDKNAIDHVLDAAANLINTNLTTEDQKEDPGMKAVEVLEDLGNSISRQLDLGNNKSVTFEKVTEDLVFGVAVINTTTSPGFIFPSDDIEMTGSVKINIPTSVFVSDKSYFVGIIFKAYREMRNNAGDLNMGTKVISAVVSPHPSDELEEPVEMTFEKNIVGPTLAQKCSFWIENDTLSGEHGRWSTRQCFKKYENESHIKCACRHFTNFAVLFQVSNKGQHQHEEHSFRLVLITYVGLGLSILGCLLTFIIYVALSNIKSDRATVHKNLVFALGIADVIFLVTVVFEPDGDSCTAAAMLAFFFYLAVFFWMLVEGVYIYLMVIKVFRGNAVRRRRIAYVVGWGCPVIIAVVTWVIFRNDVASKYHCWLSVQSGAIWAFVGPGLAIIFTNLIILIAVMKTTWTTFADDKEYGGLKSATKTFGAVIPILGITWVFGVMAFNDSSIVFQYIFAIVNSIQGALIFILYCIVNNEVRTEINRRIVVWRTRRELSVSGGQRSTYPYIMSFEGNASLNRTTTSAVGNTDLFRHALLEIEEVPASAKVEKDDSSDKTSENDFELGVKADKDGGEEKEGDEGSGRSSPLELNVELNDDCDKSTQF